MRRGQIGKLREVGAAFYAKHDAAPTNPFLAALAARGAEVIIEVWPDNWQSFDLFRLCQTQWNVGIGGRCGLRYEALYPLLDRAAKSPEQWDELFSDVRVMEYAALSQMAEDAADG